MKTFDTIEKLEAHLANSEKRIEALEKELQDVGDAVVLGKFNPKKSPDGVVQYSKEKREEIGQMFKDLRKGKINQIGDLDDMTTVEKATVGTPLTTDAITGSYTTGNQYIHDILALAEDKSHLRQFVTRVPMTDRVAYYPKEADTVEFTYVSTDGGSQSEASPTFADQIELRSYTYALWISMTESVLEDSLFGLPDFFRTKTGGALARKFDFEFLRGSGSPTTGVLEHADVNTARTGGPTFDSIDADNMFDMVELLDTEAKRDGARFIAHPTMFDKLWRIKDANGQYTFRDAILQGGNSRLIGYPWMYSGQMPSSSDSAGDTAMFALGNPAHLLWGDRISMEIKIFDQMESTAEFSEVIFRARVRMAFNIAHGDAFAILKTTS